MGIMDKITGRATNAAGDAKAEEVANLERKTS
jgi:hypothetical protein